MRRIEAHMGKSGFREKTGMQGYVRVKVNDQPTWEGPNLVLDGGLAYAATLFAGAAGVACPAATYETVDTIQIGNGGADVTPAPSPLTGIVLTPTIPVPPIRADTAINSQILNSPVGTATGTPSGFTVVFEDSFFSDNFVNTDFPDFGVIGTPALFVNEFGLYVSSPVLATPVLVARVCVPSIAFAPTSSTTITVEWTIGFL